MKKIIALLLASILVLFGCASEDVAASENMITIGVEGENAVAVMTEYSAAFTEETGIPTEVVEVQMFDLLDSLATQQGNAPDIFMLPNDRIGTLAEQKLIAPVTTDLSSFTDTAQTAASYNEENYMLPMSTDCLMFVYNKDLMTEAPATLAELDPSEWAAKFTDAYYAAGMFYSMGGYVFGDEGTNYEDIGLNTPESVEAGKAIQSLYQSGVDHWTLMQDDAVAYDVAKQAFIDGDIKAVIDGPWALAEYEAAGVNVGIAPIPSWDGTNPFQPFVGTKGLGINAYSDNVEGCQQFLEYINTPEFATDWTTTTQEVSPNTGVEYEEGSNASIILEATKAGVSMPNVPEFFAYWGPTKDALIQIATGADVQGALDAAVEKMHADIASAAQ